ncbi:hypothetical protein [Streptomyces sp. NPDC097727]|uniref:hypothetical protein n=1 Tax=Streptomyces sp. NPDC097727 TaxID=3366092 RepID=UPI00381DCAB0
MLNQVLGRDAADAPRAYEAGSAPEVRRLGEEALPALPSTYDDCDDLLAVAAREEQLAPMLELAHAERISRTAAHLVAVVEDAARSGFAQEEFSRASPAEARRAWQRRQRCLEERRRDLGR